MQETFTIAGYCRISVDDELDRDNTSIEDQKLIIKDFVKRKFHVSELKFYEYRGRSGCTFEQRDGYRIFAQTQELMKKRSKSNYRGEKNLIVFIQNTCTAATAEVRYSL